MISLRSLFHRQAEPLMGLDISSSSIKLVEMGFMDKRMPPQGLLNNDHVADPSHWVLERCAMETLDRPWVVDGHIEQLEPLAEALGRLLQRCGTTTKRVAMALPPSSVITKKINLPAGLNEAEMEAMVQVEANQYIPFPLEEVSLDFCVVGPSAASAADVEVLIAAARREKVQDLQALAESVGLDPVTVDVESYAARRAAWAAIQSVPFNGDPPMVALLELGATTSSLQVLRQGEVVFERDQAFGGAALTQAIAQQYGFSSEDAEARKRKGDLPDSYATEVLPAFLDSLAQDVARALKYFFTSTPYHRVDQILLAGGCATLSGLPQAVSHWVQTPAAVLNPFAGMALGAGLSTAVGTSMGSNPLHQRQAPSFLTACGLAMRRAA